MKRLLKSAVCAAFLFAAAALPSFASNLDYATNNGPEFFRNPAGRVSAQDSADIATNNPAGSIRMGTGLFVNVSNQTIIKKYTIRDKTT